MLKFKIDTQSKSYPKVRKDVKKYDFKNMMELKTSLAYEKTQMDDDFADRNFARYWREFDPYKYEKNIIARAGATMNVSNAWLKCYELLVDFDLLHDDTYHFDNAAFPGSFVVATHHLAENKGVEYKWVASSLWEPNSADDEPLDDKYNLLKNYPDNWLMDEKNNGDVMVRENLIDFAKKTKKQITLYTSDLGFDVSSDYNNQELLQLPAHVGQMLSGVLTLKKGGHMVVKQYTAFEACTISYIYAFSTMFDEFYICKPHTSREANSETYLVGKGLKKAIDIDHPYVVAMLDRMKNDIEMPLFDRSVYSKNSGKKFLDAMESACDKIFQRQIEKLKHDIEQARACIKERVKNPKYHPRVVRYRKSVEKDIEDWWMKMAIKPIKNKLNMRDLYNQMR